MKKSTKCFIIVVVLAGLMLPTGCKTGGTIDGNSVTRTATQVQVLSSQLTAYKAVILQLTADLQRTGAYDANTAAKITKVNNEIDKVIAQANSVATAIKDGTYDAKDQSLITLLQAFQAGNAATAPFNPYAGIIGLILTAVIAILGLYSKKKANQVVLSNTTLGAVTQAVERVSTIATKTAIKDEVASNLAAAQITAEGKALISASKNP